MSSETVRQAITARFVAKWPTGNPVTPVPTVSWPNVDFDTPESAPWARVDIATGESMQVGVAGATQGAYRAPGIVTVRVFVPKDTGTSVAYSLADHAASIFRGWESGDIHFESASINELSEDSADPWFGIAVKCAFKRYALETYTP
jgi:hypothetical protein